MIRLSEDDSVPRVEDACERHMRLCMQMRNADKYRTTIQPLFTDFESKKTAFENAGKEVNAAQDSVWLNDSILDDVLRDVHGRTKEYDRNHPGSDTAVLLFPDGNISAVITLSDKEEPDAAHGIAQKLVSLGQSHELYPLAAKIEEAVSNCRDALAQQVSALQAAGDAKTALSISKTMLVRQYNAGYFAAANDVSKSYAEKLFPQLRSSKKKADDTEPSSESKAA